jgi:glycosyltransferase involved in cell wall biosynthesis
MRLFYSARNSREADHNVSVTVGIVTPSLNKAPYLRAAIESVLAQDYPAIDYLVRDGGSTDGSLEILKEYGSRLRWVSEKDGGQAQAVNLGFRETRGEVFAFLNADDVYYPGAVRAAADAFRRSPGAGLVYGRADFLGADGSVLGPYPVAPFDRALLGRRCFICQPAAFVSRAAYAATGGVDASYFGAFDYEFWTRLSARYQAVFLDEKLAGSRMYAETKTLGSRRRLFREAMRVQRDHFGFVPYEAVHAYAQHLLDGRDQFFAPSRPSPASYLLSLPLGLAWNWRRPARYLREWGALEAVRGKFTGRWPDGWISRRYETEVEAGDRLRIAGEVPLREARLTVSLDGERVGEFVAGGAFRWELAVPPRYQGRRVRLAIESDRTFRRGGGDWRLVSCRLDAIG